MSNLDFADGIGRQRFLEEIERRYYSLLENNPDGIIEIDSSGQIIATNPACEQIFGFGSDELYGRNLIDLASIDDQTWKEHIHQSTVKGKVISGEGRLIHKNGQFIYVQQKFIPILVDNRIVGTHIVLKDITLSKLAADELERTKEQLRTIFDTLDVCLWSQDYGSRKMIQVSQGSEKIWGIPFDKLLADHTAPHHLVHPDDISAVQEKMKVVKYGEQFVHDYRIIHPNGEVRWIHDRTVPIMGEDGTPVRLTGITVDITELKLAEEERERTRQALQRSDKLSALGQFAAGIAHEIRNPLTTVMGFVQLLHSMIPERRDYFDLMMTELTRANGFISEFLTLAKPQHTLTQSHDINGIIDDILSFLRGQALMQNISILTDLSPTALTLHCDKNQIKQILINLIKNAMEAMPHGGVITIGTRGKGDNEVSISVSDKGCGIPPAVLARMGEPFFTSKENGTGLGIMVCKRLLENHGGKIFIESEVGAGTTVEVTLPIKPSDETD